MEAYGEIKSEIRRPFQQHSLSLAFPPPRHQKAPASKVEKVAGRWRSRRRMLPGAGLKLRFRDRSACVKPKAEITAIKPGRNLGLTG